MFPEFAALIFMSSEFGHRAHLRTNSFAAHSALGSFYTGLIDLRDKLVEAYQGRYGSVDIPCCEMPASGQDPLATIKEHLKLLEGLRYEAIPKEDSPIQNIVDEVVGVYLSTIYKLENLH